MFTADTVIDTVTTAQKEAIKFVKNEAVAKSLTDLVDASASSTKAAVKVSTEAFATVGKEVVKTAQEAAKYDYSKHVTETYDAWVKFFTPSKTK